jgi:hypothetical protein
MYPYIMSLFTFFPTDTTTCLCFFSLLNGFFSKKDPSDASLPRYPGTVEKDLADEVKELNKRISDLEIIIFEIFVHGREQ